jgi:Flp pilus assembly protein TadG
MKTLNVIQRSSKDRKGVMAMITALILLALLGMVACAVDVGYIAMSRTQLHVAADASALAAGTELIDGLGYDPPETNDEVVADATDQAVIFAGKHQNARSTSTYIDEDRDIEFGEATFDADGCNCWQKTPASEGASHYNYVEVTPLRNQAGSGAGDGPVSLIFARLLGVDTTSIRATATAARLPANGFRVVEEDDTANVMPFAFRDKAWEKFLRAEEYYEDHPNVFSERPNWDSGPMNQRLNQILDSNDPDTNSRNDPLFGDGTTVQNSKQTTYDQYGRSQEGAVTTGSDLRLELKIYPNNTGSSGNFGTVDLGAGGNSTNELRRKIREGLNAEDLSHYENNQIQLSYNDPLNEGANPGLSNGMKSALDDVRGQCKAIVLYDSLTGNGNNAVYRLVKFVSVSIVYNDQAKDVRVQRCTLVDNSTVPDTEEDDIDDNNTIFTPLTLIR